MAKLKYLTLNVAIISRSGSARGTGNQKIDPKNPGKERKPPSAVAAAAYRSGQALYDERAQTARDYNPKDKTLAMDARHAAAYRSGSTLEAEGGKPFDYTRKEDVVYSNILAPDGAPDWVFDRQTLWNNVERAEKRKDAQLARDVIAALPRELSREQQIALVQEFVRENFTSKGMVADVNIHEKDASDGGRNPHVHIMLTTRKTDGDGFFRLKERTWNGEWKGAGKNGGKMLEDVWRPSYERICNEHLEAAGSDARVSTKSFQKDGVEKEPQKHMGYEAAGLEKKGQESRRGYNNRRILHRNDVRDIIEQRLEWQDSEAAMMGWMAEKPNPPHRQPQISPGSLSPSEVHRTSLREYLSMSFKLPMAAASELVVRTDDMLMEAFDEVRDVGWDVFEKVTGWQERERRMELRPDDGREQELEREREHER